MRFTLSLMSAVVFSVFVSQSCGAVDFTEQIKPIFAAHCNGCHGEEKGLGKLRLHSVEAIAASQEKHDDLIADSNASQSTLYTRLILPVDNKKRMPKKADPLSEEQTALIKQWIDEGAIFTTISFEAPKMTEQTGGNAPERPALEPASAEAIAAAEQLGVLITPLFSKSTELRASFPSEPGKVTDETVAALIPLAGQIVELDLSGTAITDASAESLGKLQNIDILHLEKTADIRERVNRTGYLQQ